jgi:hypothetical protein
LLYMHDVEKALRRKLGPVDCDLCSRFITKNCRSRRLWHSFANDLRNARRSIEPTMMRGRVSQPLAPRAQASDSRSRHHCH